MRELYTLLFYQFWILVYTLCNIGNQYTAKCLIILITSFVHCRINYPPVKSRLERIMGTHIVRLTDRKYMLHYMAKIIEDHEKLQKIRIEERKLAPPTIISQLLELSYKALVKKLAEPGYSKITLYM